MSSSSAEKPRRMTPPSARVAGGSSAMACGDQVGHVARMGRLPASDGCPAREALSELWRQALDAWTADSCPAPGAERQQLAQAGRCRCDDAVGQPLQVAQALQQRRAVARSAQGMLSPEHLHAQSSRR